MKYLLASIVGILGIAATPAWAGPNVSPFFGETLTLLGTVGREVDPSTTVASADPFTLGIFSAGNECLRIAVTAQNSVDLEATLVAPGGRVWQDDDGNGSLRPLIKAITTVRGWYELAVSQFVGTAVHDDFRFEILRTSTTDSRCNPPTGPRVFAPTTLKPGKAPEGIRSLPGSP